MPDRKHDPARGRPEFEVAYYTKELGQPLQRQMLRKHLAQFIGTGAKADGQEPEGAAQGGDAAQPQPGSTP